MSTESKKSPRTVDEIKNEYSHLALRAGNLQYQIVEFQRDLALVNEQMRDLNFEHASNVAKESESK